MLLAGTVPTGTGIFISSVPVTVPYIILSFFSGRGNSVFLAHCTIIFCSWLLYTVISFQAADPAEGAVHLPDEQSRCGSHLQAVALAGSPAEQPVRYQEKGPPSVMCFVNIFI